MSKNTSNSPRQNPPAGKLPIEPWTLRQAATWILFRDLDRVRRAKGGSLSAAGLYAAKDDPDFPQRRKEESDSEVSDRIEAYLNDRNSTHKTDQLGWFLAQAELIDSLKNSQIRSISVKDRVAAISSDVWKVKLLTFPAPNYVRVFSDEIMTKWQPLGQVEQSFVPTDAVTQTEFDGVPGNKTGPKPEKRRRVAEQMIKDFKSGETRLTDTLENLGSHYKVSRNTAKNARADALARLPRNYDGTLTEL